MEKYRIVAQDLAQKIESGVYKGGEQIPLENELCNTYQVSRITIKKATDQLVQLGLITKRRGAGSFVKERPHQETAISDIGNHVQFTGFTRQFADHKVATTLNKFVVVPATGEVAERLNLSEDDLVYYICRTRYVDDEPYVVEYTYMPVETIPGINRRVLLGSIYSYILENLQLKPQSAHRTLRAVLPTKQEMEYFQATEQFALLEIEQVAYLDDGRIFEFSRSHCRGDKYNYKCVSIW